MREARRVRVIKGGRAAREAEAARAHAAGTPAGAPGREVRDVVSDWVRDHRRRSDEFRRNYSALLGQVGFKAPGCCGSAA